MKESICSLFKFCWSKAIITKGKSINRAICEGEEKENFVQCQKGNKLSTFGSLNQTHKGVGFEVEN